MTKVTFNTSVKRKNTFDKSSMHITTLDFGRPIVSNFLPVIKGDSVHVSLNQFMRLSPLAVPTYGNFKLETRAFYTPMRLLNANWYDFKSQRLGMGDSGRVIPYTTNSRIFSTILSYSTEVPLTDAHDFESANGTSTNKAYKLTRKGRAFVQLLNSLGYEINYTTSDTTELSLMPLLSYLRVFYDVMYPSRYLNSVAFGDLFTLYSYTESTDAQSILDAFSDTLYSFYEGDFFCDAWKFFNSAGGLNPYTNDSVTTTSFRDLSSNSSNGGSTRDIKVNNTGVFNDVSLTSGASKLITLSSYGHRLLDSLSDFVLRNNLAGSRFLDYIKAHFGFTTSAEKSQYTQFLGSYISNSSIMDVTSTAETLGLDSGDVLGAQAGKGYINGQGQLNFDVDEDGYIIFITQIKPSYGYYQGRKPWTLRKKDPIDYYTPEFDNLGNEAIRNDMLFAESRKDTEYTNGQSYGLKPSSVFGFAPRYANEYKRGHDYLTGDFRFASRNIGLDSFHTFRRLDVPSQSSPMALGLAFSTIDNQYDRVFSSNFVNNPDDPEDIYDHFIGYFEYRVKVQSFMLTMSESLPFYDDEGREVTLNKQ